MKKSLPSSGSSIFFSVNAGILLLIAICFGLMLAYSPLQLDDYMFLNVYRQHNGDISFSFRGIAEFVKEIRTYDNSRLSNVMAPIFCGMEPWHTLFPIFGGLAAAFTVWFGTKLVLYHTDSSQSGYPAGIYPFTLSLLWGLIMLFLPWRNNIFVADYTLNYIFSAFITISLLWIFLLLANAPERFSTGQKALLLLLCIIAGAWHEGFALPAICGLGLYTLLKRFKMPVFWYLAIALYLASTLLVMICPGMLTRMAREATETAPNHLKTVADLSAVILAVGTYIILLIIPRYRNYIKRITTDPVIVIVGGAMIAATVISLFVKHTPRTAFFPELCAVIILLRLALPLYKRIGKKSALVLTLTFIAAVAALFVHALIWQIRFYNMGTEIIKGIEKSASGTFFYDIIMPEEVPISTLYLPTRTYSIEGYHYQCLGEWFPGKIPAVAPEALRNPHLHSRVMSGEASDTVYASLDALWTREIPDLFSPVPATFNITMKDGSVLPGVEGLALGFESETGEKLTYLKPYKISTSEIETISLENWGKKSD